MYKKLSQNVMLCFNFYCYTFIKKQKLEVAQNLTSIILLL